MGMKRLNHLPSGKRSFIKDFSLRELNECIILINFYNVIKYFNTLTTSNFLIFFQVDCIKINCDFSPQ